MVSVMSAKKVVVIVIGIVLMLGGMFAVFITLAASSEDPPEDYTEEEKKEWRDEQGTAAMFCFTISIIIILVGLVIAVMGFMIDKKAQTQPVIVMQQPYQQQPSTIEGKVDAKLQQGTMPNFCPSCGSQRGSSNFCPNCGYRYV